MTAFLPGQIVIGSYSSGGFHFGGMSHAGAILALPSGIHGWLPSTPLTPADFADVFSEAQGISLFLLGTGRSLLRPPAQVRQAFASRGLVLECMDTGAAVGTYNLLLAEKRKVAAGLLVPAAAP